MTNVSDLGAKRWENSDKPRDCRPMDALDAARRFIEENGEPDHIVIFFGRKVDNGGDGSKYFQAGNYRYHAQMGLVYEGMQLMRESGTGD